MSNQLLEAVQKRSVTLKAVQAALTAGANLEARDDRENTPLHLLCKSKSGVMSKSELEAAQLLVGKGADVMATNKDGATPLHLAAAGGSLEMIDTLLENGAKVSRDKYGNTPLHYCLTTRNKQTAIWDRLLANGCTVADANKNGDTPLHTAGASCNELAVTYLLSKGADAAAKDGKGRTVLDNAREYKQDKIIKLVETHAT